MISNLVSQTAVVAFAGLMVWAALSDGRRFIIPNGIPAAVTGLWLAYAAARLIGGASAGDVAVALALGVGTFGIGMLLFALRLLGGGDVKLLAAVMPWAGPQLALQFVTITAVIGGVLGLALLAARLVRNLAVASAFGAAVSTISSGSPSGQAAARPGWGGAVSAALKSPIPFGVAIAAGGLFVAYSLMFGL